MNEEIEKIKKNETWTLVPTSKENNIIGTKWIFRNKLNHKGEVTRNKEIRVCKGYAQGEGLDYGETFSPIAILGVRTLLTYSSYKGFKVYLKHAKSTFPNGILEEEVYVEKIEGFIYPNKNNIV